ncbi:zinc metalloprotease [Nocardia salmonicida]|uniref:hypothetical protein n=1 Tax=Nocardia salmonicida TaxID=53431 RepID=UPI00363E0AD1
MATIVIVGLPVREGISFVLTEPLTSLSIIGATLTGSALLHEAGHYAVARRLGHRPVVGVGLYLSGPVFYIDLSAIESASRRDRMRSALAGPAVDGYVLSLLGICNLAIASPILVVAILIGSSAAVLALRPSDKSDGYWAIRDWFGARRIAATWANPAAFVRVFRSGSRAERRFVAVLAACYVATGTVITLNLVRWITEVTHLAAADPHTWWRCARIAAVYGGVATVFGALWYVCARLRPAETLQSATSSKSTGNRKQA